jgi:type II secretory pathway pseudopilin PulG
MMRGSNHRSFTLLELVVVMAILVALAGIMVSLVSGIQDDASVEATRVSMKTISEAILGAGSEKPGYLADIGDLPTTLSDLYVKPSGIVAYDRFTGRGWRGPYLRSTANTYQADADRGFLPDYGEDGDPTPFDSWGHPIILQMPSPVASPDPDQRREFARLVSAGPDGILQVQPQELYPSPEARGDDLVLFLLRSDVAP